MKFLKQWFNEGGLRELLGWLLSAVLAVYLPAAWAVLTAGFIAAVVALAVLVQYIMRHPGVMEVLEKKK